LNYFKRIIKTIDTSLNEYNIFYIGNVIELNVYLNGLLLKEDNHYEFINDKIIFDKSVLKNLDIICIDYINNMETYKIYNNINKFIYCYNDSSLFEINMKVQNDNFINIYINGILQDSNYEYIIEQDMIKYVQINTELKTNDIIILECVECERSEK